MGTTNTFLYQSAAATALVNAAETAVLTIGPIGTRGPSDQLEIAGLFSLTTGATTTAVVMRVRRGNGLAGVVVGAPQTTQLGAALPGTPGFQVVDTPGDVGDQFYTVTAQQTGGTSNGTATYAAAEITLP